MECERQPVHFLFGSSPADFRTKPSEIAPRWARSRTLTTAASRGCVTNRQLPREARLADVAGRTDSAARPCDGRSRRSVLSEPSRRVPASPVPEQPDRKPAGSANVPEKIDGARGTASLVERQRYRSRCRGIHSKSIAQKLLPSGVVKGLNNKAQVTMRKSYGFHRLPHLPLPRTCALPLAWQITRAGIDPRFLLTSLHYRFLQKTNLDVSPLPSLRYKS